MTIDTGTSISIVIGSSTRVSLVVEAGIWRGCAVLFCRAYDDEEEEEDVVAMRWPCGCHAGVMPLPCY